MPDGNAVSPPKLPRNAPVADVFKPIEQNLSLVLRNYANPLLADGGGSARRHGFHAAEPLRGDARLDFAAAAVASSHRMRMIFHAFEQAQFDKVGDDFFARGISIESGIRAASGVDVRVLGKNIDGNQLVPFAHFKVVGVVAGSDFQRTGAEIAFAAA